MKDFIINDIDSLQKEFYKMYDPDYWLYRIMLLKNSHDNFDSLKDTLTKNTEDHKDEDFKRVIRTELHFLYFQMIETLFEIIFAIYEKDNRDLWLSLTFSDYKENYRRIAELNDYSDLFTQKIKTEINGQEKEIPMLRWVFYFVYNLKLNDDEWVKNLENIKKVLVMFAREFSDRGEYNAYKHSLRFYNSPFSMSIGIDGTGVMQEIGSANDCITFLEEQKKKDVNGNLQPTGQIMKIKKPFDFERDYNLCLAIYSMIKTIVYTRKYSLLKEFNGKNFDLLNFTNLDSIKISFSGGVTKTSFTV
jgi:hypothetical protein